MTHQHNLLNKYETEINATIKAQDDLSKIVKNKMRKRAIKTIDIIKNEEKKK